jgi:hypothetical protein
VKNNCFVKEVCLLVCKLWLNTGRAAVHATTVVLDQSGLNSLMTAPGSNRHASLISDSYPHGLSTVPSAQWIWDVDNSLPTCNMNITVQ